MLTAWYYPAGVRVERVDLLAGDSREARETLTSQVGAATSISSSDKQLTEQGTPLLSEIRRQLTDLSGQVKQVKSVSRDDLKKTQDDLSAKQQQAMADEQAARAEVEKQVQALRSAFNHSMQWLAEVIGTSLTVNEKMTTEPWNAKIDEKTPPVEVGPLVVPSEVLTDDDGPINMIIPPSSAAKPADIAPPVAPVVPGTPSAESEAPPATDVTDEPPLTGKLRIRGIATDPATPSTTVSPSVPSEPVVPGAPATTSDT